jgi:hypothetical protein
MLRLFGKTDKNPQPQAVARSYVGVAAFEYGGDFNLSALILGERDEELKAKPFFKVFIGNKVFDNLADAVKQTSKRGVSKKVLTLLVLNVLQMKLTLIEKKVSLVI